MSENRCKSPVIVVEREVIAVGLGRVYKPQVAPCPKVHWHVPGLGLSTFSASETKHYLKLFYGKDTFVEMVTKKEKSLDIYLRFEGDVQLIPKYFLAYFENITDRDVTSLRKFQIAKKHVKQLLGI